MPTNFRHWTRLKHALSNIFYEWWSYGKDEKIAKFVDSLCDVWWNKSIVHNIIFFYFFIFAQHYFKAEDQTNLQSCYPGSGKC